MTDGKTKNQLNALFRKKASTALFPILNDLGIEAALAHEGAFSLHRSSSREGPREIKVVVKYEPDHVKRADDICKKVVAHVDGQCFSRTHNTLNPWQLEYKGTDLDTEGQKCRIYFILSGGSSPTILQDFNEILHIDGIPVMPIHTILLEQVLLVSDPDPVKRRGISVVLVDDCLKALGDSDVVLEQLSPLWKAPNVLNAVKLLVLQKQGRDSSRWIKLGIQPQLFRAVGPSVIPSRSLSRQMPTPTHSPSPIAHESPPPSATTDTSRAVINLVATVVISALSGLGFDSAIFGSTACQLYGSARPPGDLDVLVLPPEPFHQNGEWIKEQIVNKHPSQFVLRWGKTPGATYRVLFYRFGYGIPVPSMFAGSRECKVDILLPGTMHLPRLTTSDIVLRDGLPVVPFLTLLVQKLQGWGDHLDSSEQHKFQKHPVDAQDVSGLLALSESLPLTVMRPWREKSLMTDEFQVVSLVRVKRFCRIFPEAKPCWRMLGFNVE